MCMTKDQEIRHDKLIRLENIRHDLRRSLEMTDKSTQEWNSYNNMLQKVSKKIRDLEIQEAQEALDMPEATASEQMQFNGANYVREDVADKKADEKVEQESRDLGHGALWCMAIAGLVGYALGKKKGQNQMIRQFVPTVPSKIDE